MDSVSCHDIKYASEKDCGDDKDRLKELVVVYGILHAFIGNIVINKDEDNPVDKKEEPNAEQFDTVSAPGALGRQHTMADERIYLAEESMELPGEKQAYA